ncbi:DUF4158 domain-containing protein [Actinomadura verrucosospora]|uniref:DUF4158 domain-containing protein n=1 Tax=Actinomadura verrucosospora TaxID=46165 RepID=UPI0015653F57|nr:DUF4158 domain-containing protein [Actinomadura verrucosospora]
MGVATQIATVCFKKLFLEDPFSVPWPVVDYPAEQLGIGDPLVGKRYGEQPKRLYEHAWVIRDAYGFHILDDREGGSSRSGSWRSCMGVRDGTREGTTALFDRSAVWLPVSEVVCTDSRSCLAHRERPGAAAYGML